MATTSFKEDQNSQLPAIQQLQKPGYAVEFASEGCYKVTLMEMVRK
ncbi:MAG: hypothetical protein FD170_1227 [Bacteroidetes bacterium]|nr:MAG: hypothetical protein FD170_1227 [Bacteroidota bacterium]